MRANIHHKTVLLVTDDVEFEAVVRNVAGILGSELRSVKTNQEAMCEASDASARDSFVVLDLDGRVGRRALLNTFCGMLPVIAISRGEKPWVKALRRRCRIVANLAKPVTPGALIEAMKRVGDLPGMEAPFLVRSAFHPSTVETVFEADFRQTLRLALGRRASRVGGAHSRSAPTFE
jgi:hypothetical protein